MLRLSCPACGGEIIFKSSASVFTVCAYCKMTAVRHDVNLETYGSMADVQMDQSPLQIGTRGRFEGKSFEVIGRLRIRWQDGFWNEWYVLFDDGRAGWLAEAQGSYAMNFQEPDVSYVPRQEDLRVGQEVKLHSSKLYFKVDDIKKVRCIGSEGELPVAASVDRESVSVDLSALGNQYAGVEYFQGNVRLFFGQYCDFDKFEFSFLREIDGW